MSDARSLKTRDIAALPCPACTHRKRNGHLGSVAAAHAVGYDVHVVAGVEQVDGGLRDADVALDANEDAGERARGAACVECLLDLGGAVSKSMGGGNCLWASPTAWRSVFCRRGIAS